MCERSQFLRRLTQKGPWRVRDAHTDDVSAACLAQAEARPVAAGHGAVSGHLGRPEANPHPTDGQGASEKGRGCPSVPRAGAGAGLAPRPGQRQGGLSEPPGLGLKCRSQGSRPFADLGSLRPGPGIPGGWGTAEPTLGSPQRGSSWAPPGSSPTSTFPECEIPHLHGARSQAQHRRPATWASRTVGTLPRATPTLLSHPVWGAGASFPPPACLPRCSLHHSPADPTLPGSVTEEGSHPHFTGGDRQEGATSGPANLRGPREGTRSDLLGGLPRGRRGQLVIWRRCCLLLEAPVGDLWPGGHLGPNPGKHGVPS